VCRRWQMPGAVASVWLWGRCEICSQRPADRHEFCYEVEMR
jgi:hypothetical protein